MRSPFKPIILLNIYSFLSVVYAVLSKHATNDYGVAVIDICWCRSLTLLCVCALYFKIYDKGPIKDLISNLKVTLLLRSCLG
jgi:hypothetical protein